MSVLRTTTTFTTWAQPAAVWPPPFFWTSRAYSLPVYIAYRLQAALVKQCAPSWGDAGRSRPAQDSETRQQVLFCLYTLEYTPFCRARAGPHSLGMNVHYMISVQF